MTTIEPSKKPYGETDSDAGSLDRRDAERYRYLRDFAHPDDDIGLFVSTSERNDWGNRYTKHWTGEALDAAIDTALRSNTKQKGDTNDTKLRA